MATLGAALDQELTKFLISKLERREKIDDTLYAWADWADRDFRMIVNDCRKSSGSAMSRWTSSTRFTR